METNIGIHLFDLCAWIFGDFEGFTGKTLKMERAIVNWHLGTDGTEAKRLFLIDGEPVDLTCGFNDLHTELYGKTIAGEGFGIEDTRQAVRIVEALR